MLDSANYNTSQVNITKSVTLRAIPGAVGSLVATGGADAIFINTSGVSVVLRNLVINQLGSSTNGIELIQGDALLVEDCEIANMGSDAIRVNSGTTTVRNTVLRNSDGGFDAIGSNALALLSNVHIGNNASFGVRANSGGTVFVTNSVLAWNPIGG